MKKFLMVLFAGLLLPMFARMLKLKERLEALIESSLQIIWTGAISLCIACYCFQEEIMLLLYDAATPYWGEVLGYLMISFIAVSGTYIFGTLLTANNSMKRMNLIFLASILLNVLLNAFLIPSYKASGAAIATAGTQLFAMIAQIYLAIRLLDLRLSLRIPFRIVVFTLSLILLTVGIQHYIMLIWWQQLGLTFLVATILAMLSGMISTQSISDAIGEGLKSKSAGN